ncbi:MAG: cobalamin biosynthesis protein CobW [Rhodospirillaceae bacterium]|nr:cobalamin biosynthesis protein CobW [Rhodospirillaceae bacterium]MBT5674223.1 cobalamin biosynthesis protein CobW [Rhodospirillaceae bacterium]MBT5778664.1 cobalamin biosynthesis protein CobW [Rhodospirillaceae bacterium]MBT6828379.1 cobalamin biosynthesis protein CobW [Rhodospirillaceae bacterium]MBT7292876.1 cobalamin biosynthesis protein CobW [Rhodospirillaceae bacterium]
MQSRKIPTTVISGFLGAGKTSLIRHVLATANGRRVALIINEFGDLGVDESLLRGCGDDACASGEIIELANGCICCTVADDFVPTIEALLARDPAPEHIVIETSGLALPKPLVAAFNWPEIRNRVTVDGVVAVVDGPALLDGRFAADPAALQAQREADEALDHESPLEEVFEDQLSCADLVVLNKVDQLDDAACAQTRSLLARELRPGVKVVEAEQARIDADILLGLAAAAEDDLAARPSHHDEFEGEHDHDEFDSFILELGPIAEPEALEARLIATIERHDILRIKGFVDVPGKRRRHVIQAVGTRVARHFDRDWGTDEARQSRLVVIGLSPLDRDAISVALSA